MTARSRKSPMDHTGRQADLLAQENAEKLQARSGNLSTLNAVPEVDLDIDSGGGVTFSGTVEVSAPTRKLRVNTDLENVTIGRGTDFNFARGKTYNVDAHVYDHLERLGYVYH